MKPPVARERKRADGEGFPARIGAGCWFERRKEELAEYERSERVGRQQSRVLERGADDVGCEPARIV